MKIDIKKLELALARSCTHTSQLRSVVSSQTIYRIRKGDEVKPHTLGVIASVLGVDPAELLEEERRGSQPSGN